MKTEKIKITITPQGMSFQDSPSLSARVRAKFRSKRAPEPEPLLPDATPYMTRTREWLGSKIGQFAGKIYPLSQFPDPLHVVGAVKGIGTIVRFEPKEGRMQYAQGAFERIGAHTLSAQDAAKLHTVDLEHALNELVDSDDKRSAPHFSYAKKELVVNEFALHIPGYGVVFARAGKNYSNSEHVTDASPLFSRSIARDHFRIIPSDNYVQDMISFAESEQEKPLLERRAILTDVPCSLADMGNTAFEDANFEKYGSLHIPIRSLINQDFFNWLFAGAANGYVESMEKVSKKFYYGSDNLLIRSLFPAQNTSPSIHQIGIGSYELSLRTDTPRDVLGLIPDEQNK